MSPFPYLISKDVGEYYGVLSGEDRREEREEAPRRPVRELTSSLLSSVAEDDGDFYKARIAYNILLMGPRVLQKYGPKKNSFVVTVLFFLIKK